VSDEVNALSKFLSYVLRHKPEHIGLELDREGWAVVAELIAGAAEKGVCINSSKVQELVSLSDKKRFEISSDGLRIRAIQGHSTKLVRRSYVEFKPPLFLYHGTATHFLDSIRQHGLNAGERHHVHLTQDKNSALEVGRRYGKVVILKVSSRSMHVEGYKFFKTENDVWLTACVPPKFITEVEME
jgi:putative RNA 2'-phosphotransferase